MLLLNEREHLETLELLGLRPETAEIAREKHMTALLTFPWGQQQFYVWEKKEPMIILAS